MASDESLDAFAGKISGMAARYTGLGATLDDGARVGGRRDRGRERWGASGRRRGGEAAGGANGDQVGGGDGEH